MILTPYPADFYHGDDPVNAVYCGDTLIWWRRLFYDDAKTKGTGALAAVLMARPFAPAAPHGTGALGALIQPGYVLVLSGSGALTVSTKQIIPIPAATGGGGALSAALFRRSPMAAPLTGTGRLSATAYPIGVTPVIGNGTLSATVKPIAILAATARTGSGELTAGWTLKMTSPGALDGGGALTAVVEMYSTTQTVGQSGSGTLTATLRMVYSRLSALLGNGTLTGVAAGRWYLTAVLGGSGVLSAAAKAGYGRDLALDGSGALSAIVKQIYPLATALSGSGTYDGVGFDSAFPDGLSAKVRGYITTAQVQGGSGTLVATVKQIYPPRAFPLTGAGQLTAELSSRSGNVNANERGDGVLTSVVDPGHHYSDLFT
jgi:hypothetical protein